MNNQNREGKIHNLFKEFAINNLSAEQENKLYEVEKVLIALLTSERIRILEITNELDEYAVHAGDCILAQWSAGRNTKDGGYEQRFAGKWYQVRPIDKTPKCNCGLDDVRKALTGMKEEGSKQ